MKSYVWIPSLAECLEHTDTKRRKRIQGTFSPCFASVLFPFENTIYFCHYKSKTGFYKKTEKSCCKMEEYINLNSREWTRALPWEAALPGATGSGKGPESEAQRTSRSGEQSTWPWRDHMEPDRENMGSEGRGFEGVLWRLWGDWRDLKNFRTLCMWWPI